MDDVTADLGTVSTSVELKNSTTTTLVAILCIVELVASVGSLSIQKGRLFFTKKHH